MRKKVKILLKKKLWFLIAFRNLVIRKESYLHITGWIESLKRGYPCDPEGSEVPWMNYPIINILKERLNNELKLFEFGSGYSTLFYANLVRDVTSVEFDVGWFDLMKKKAPDNVSLLYREKDIDGIYCRTISEFDEKFDVVIVDGRDRVNCVKQGIENLSKTGVVILDDSRRERYSEVIEYAKNKGFRMLNIVGLKPTGYEVYRTTIFYRENNCLNI